MTDLWTASSTDMGDVSAIVPSLHAYACGSAGTMHGKDYYVEDKELSCVENARFQLALVEKLLSNGASVAKEIIDKYVPVFNNLDEYLAHKKRLSLAKNTVSYNDDGSVVIDFN